MAYTEYRKVVVQDACIRAISERITQNKETFISLNKNDKIWSWLKFRFVSAWESEEECAKYYDRCSRENMFWYMYGLEKSELQDIIGILNMCKNETDVVSGTIFLSTDDIRLIRIYNF